MGHPPGGANSTFQAIVEGNTVKNAAGDGLFVKNRNRFGLPGNVALFQISVQGNTFEDSGRKGLHFQQGGIPGGIVNLDAGGGALGSDGTNRIINSADADIASDGYAVIAENNWWGSATGPSTVLELNGGTVDYVPFLTGDPGDDDDD